MEGNRMRLRSSGFFLVPKCRCCRKLLIWVRYAAVRGLSPRLRAKCAAQKEAVVTAQTLNCLPTFRKARRETDAKSGIMHYKDSLEIAAFLKF